MCCLHVSWKKTFPIHLKKITGCLWARKIWQPSASHEAAMRCLIPTVLLSLKIPYTRGNFWTERSFISAHRPEHRHSHSAGGHSHGKNHAESIWRAWPFRGITLHSCVGRHKWLFLSLGTARKAILCDHVFLHKQRFILCLFSWVLSQLILTVKLW